MGRDITTGPNVTTEAYKDVLPSDLADYENGTPLPVQKSNPIP
jgi:hypothetical protein